METWTTAELMELIEDNRIKPPVGFWSSRARADILMSTEAIQFDQLPSFDTRLAPIVSPRVQGKIMRSRGIKRMSFAPAYLKPKHEVRPDQALVIRRGERATGDLTPAQRFDLAVNENMVAERDSIERRIDWMACQALANGAVTIVGENYPEQVVDFQRDAALTLALSGGTRWSESTATPITDIAKMRRRTVAKGKTVVTDIVFGMSAWLYFASNPEVKALLNTQVRGSNSEVDQTGGVLGLGVEYMGYIGSNETGSYRLWVYANDYEDPETGTVTPYINTNDVIGLGDAQLYIAFGTIMDVSVMRAARMFPKMWEEDDPSVMFTMTQSAPLAVPVNPNATFRLRVASADSPAL
jgi:hypothetical protein